MVITTTPGFSSRSTDTATRQFPQRDERMSEMEQEAGWSNSEPVEDVAESVYPDIDAPEELDPGFSNAKAVGGDAPEVEAKVVEDDKAEDKSVKPAAKKAPAKKKG